MKPNLKSHPYLYRGQKKHFTKIQSGFFRCKNDIELSSEQLIRTLLCEEFIRYLRSYPLFRLLDQGIYLKHLNEPLFIKMNYLGLAQHYNFSTPYLDFTSSIEAAAFFATTINLGNDKYEPYGGTKDNRFGVLYLHKIDPISSFSNGFSSIGQQIFPRTGAQKGFFYSGVLNYPFVTLPVENMVNPLYFRHDIKESMKIFKLMDNGKRLFPKDSLSQIAREIINKREISEITFALNLFKNQGQRTTFLKLCKENNNPIKITSVINRTFSEEVLTKYLEDLKDGIWENFCKPIFIPGPNGKKIKKELLNLPYSPLYSQYFKEGILRTVYLYDLYDHYLYDTKIHLTSQPNQ
ncbi:MAG: FRG domain-containing protein [Ruminococcus sp.]|nr:FRG domain-containing protein [Ruminococcus sp.]